MSCGSKSLPFFLDQVNFVDVMACQEFLQLKPTDVLALFASDDLNVPSEETVFKVSHPRLFVIVLWPE